MKKIPFPFNLKRVKPKPEVQINYVDFIPPKPTKINHIDFKPTKSLKSKAPSFRISARNLFLTYSQVSSEITSKQIIDQLQQKPGQSIAKYVISKESHADGGIHFHVILVGKKKFSIKDPKVLDIEFNSNIFHGNYQAVRSLTNVVEYVCKKGDYITDFANIRNGRFYKPKELLIEDVQALGLETALLRYAQVFPEAALGSATLLNASKHFNKLQRLQQAFDADSVDTPFKIKDFKLSPELQNWVENPVGETLLLVGASGIGKTVFAKTFANEKQLKTLKISHWEDFRRINSYHRLIIIDDISYANITSLQFLALVDARDNKTLRVLYDAVNKSSNMIQIICMNHAEFQQIQHFLQEPRFSRRLLIQFLTEPFIINMNVNVHINHQIHINNHYHTGSAESLQPSQNVPFLTLAQSKKREKLLLERNAKAILAYAQSQDK